MTNTRKEYNLIRRQYEKDNPICEHCRCRPTVTTHHVVQKSGGSYEDDQCRVYLAICNTCHDANIHTTKGKQVCIRMKAMKGEWFATEQEERDFFGGRVHFDGWS